MSTWNKLTVREITDEEKEMFEDCTFMWEGSTPELFEKVLITTTKSIDEAYIDEWTERSVGVGFEDTDVDLGEIIYWASIPEFDLED